MRITRLSFENYKAFKKKQTLEIKPITILIGKNSSGKSAIAKLIKLLEGSFSVANDEPILVRNDDVELGAEFRDLAYNRIINVPIKFEIAFDHNVVLEVSLLQESGKYEVIIFEWHYKSEDFELTLKYSPTTATYLDIDGKNYVCEFKGFIPTKMQVDNEDVISRFKFSSFTVDYIGPFRVLPQRQYYLSGQMGYPYTGTQGQNAYSILAVSKLMKTELHQDVGEWYRKHFDGWALTIEDKNKPFIQVLLSKDNVDLSLVDVGQGMNQLLPIVVRSFIKRENSITVLEQPELHLHPAAHADIAELLAKSSKTNNQSFLIETHSENILLRLRNLVVQNDFGFSKDDVVVYWIETADREGTDVVRIDILEDGKLTEWPEGVFNENVGEIMRMKETVAKKREAPRTTNDSKI
jgi:predicted ATPase